MSEEGYFIKVVNFICFWEREEPKKEFTDDDDDAEDAAPDVQRAKTILIIGGIVLLLSVIGDLILHNFHEWAVLNPLPYSGIKFAITICRDISIAMVTSGLVALIIEVKGIISFTQKAVTKALTSKSYLKKLKVAQLKAIKDWCNELIFQKGGNKNEENLNQSLINLEANISEYIFSPYYETFRLHIVCSDVILNDEPAFKKLTHLPPNTKGIKKQIRTSYKLINPQSKGATEPISISSINLHCPEMIEDPSILNSVEKFTYRIDKGAIQTTPLRYENDLTYKPSQDSAYNKVLNMKSEHGDLDLKFNDELQIDIEETRYVFEFDHFFTRKMSKPSKSTIINYTYDKKGVTLKGSCFGFGTQNEQDIQIFESGPTVNIESKSWFLPGNGMIIVHLNSGSSPAAVAPPNNTTAAVTPDVNLEGNT